MASYGVQRKNGKSHLVSDELKYRLDIPRTAQLGHTKGRTMDRLKFMDAISGKAMHMTRTCLATGRVTDDDIVTPSKPIHLEQSSSIVLRSIHCYNDDDLFTYDFGVYVAVVKTEEWHLFCDRFVPVANQE